MEEFQESLTIYFILSDKPRQGQTYPAFFMANLKVKIVVILPGSIIIAKAARDVDMIWKAGLMKSSFKEEIGAPKP